MLHRIRCQSQYLHLHLSQNCQILCLLDANILPCGSGKPTTEVKCCLRTAHLLANTAPALLTHASWCGFLIKLSYTCWGILQFMLELTSLPFTIDTWNKSSFLALLLSWFSSGNGKETDVQGSISNIKKHIYIFGGWSIGWQVDIMNHDSKKKTIHQAKPNPFLCIWIKFNNSKGFSWSGSRV